MPVWITVSARDGSVVRVDEPQKQVHRHLGGQVTFVGALPSLNAFLLAQSEAPDLPIHPWAQTPVHADVFLQGVEVRGDLAVIASDRHGREADLDVDAAVQLLCPALNVEKKKSAHADPRSE